LDGWVYPTSATLQIEIKEIINNLNKRVKYEEPCDGRLSSTVPREGRVKVPPLTRLTNMKTKAEILQLLKCYKSTAQNKYGMTKIGIFGSVARGEQKEGSDVDVYYEGEAPSFLTLDMIQSELEELLGSKVDIVRVRDNMNSLLRQRILRDGIYV